MTGLALAAPSLNVLGANDDLRLAVIGLGGKGGQHVERFSQAPGARVTALGEPDPQRLAAHANRLKQRGTTVFTATDPRRVVERSDVDAVVIATPNHWHALPTVWALRAGKDVYVEKPVSLWSTGDGDQEEMGFGAHVATAITEQHGGVVTSSADLKTAKGTWGQPAEWCDSSGTVNGQRVGLTLMTDPANFRPSWWHNRDYGLMVANPFGRESMNQGEPSRGQLDHEP